MPGGASGRGTGSNLTKATVIICGVASLVASLLSFLYELLFSSRGPIQLHTFGNSLTSRSKISLASNVRMQLWIDRREALTGNVERIIGSHSCSDMLSASCLCMQVTLHTDRF